ncbi:MAG: hypothetical protein LBC17_01850 [Lactobacillaceae bacterium]|jgi:hypothetical protein|nr:hypothetical protein [Lactobacillaceae bacterium]
MIKAILSIIKKRKILFLTNLILLFLLNIFAYQAIIPITQYLKAENRLEQINKKSNYMFNIPATNIDESNENKINKRNEFLNSVFQNEFNKNQVVFYYTDGISENFTKIFKIKIAKGESPKIGETLIGDQLAKKYKIGDKINGSKISGILAKNQVFQNLYNYTYSYDDLSKSILKVNSINDIAKTFSWGNMDANTLIINPEKNLLMKIESKAKKANIKLKFVPISKTIASFKKEANNAFIRNGIIAILILAITVLVSAYIIKITVKTMSQEFKALKLLGLNQNQIAFTVFEPSAISGILSFIVLPIVLLFTPFHLQILDFGFLLLINLFFIVFNYFYSKKVIGEMSYED